jgi:hypothetical protein
MFTTATFTINTATTTSGTGVCDSIISKPPLFSDNYNKITYEWRKTKKNLKNQSCVSNAL